MEMTPELTDYHNARLGKERDDARTALAHRLACYRLGSGVDQDNPIGRDMLAYARDMFLPDADALLDCPGITVTAEQS